MRKWSKENFSCSRSPHGLECGQCGSPIEVISHLPMGKALRMILWLPRVYSMSTVMGAEYVMSRKRHWNRIRQSLHLRSREAAVPTASESCFSSRSKAHDELDLSMEHSASCSTCCLRTPGVRSPASSGRE